MGRYGCKLDQSHFGTACGLHHKARRYILSLGLACLRSPIAQVNSAMSGVLETRVCNVEQALNEKVE